MKRKFGIYRSYLIYGIAMGVVLILLEIIHYKAIVRDIQLELFAFLIGCIFLIVGLWLGIYIFRKKEGKEIINANGYRLSTREKEVLQLLSEGFSNQEIADRLFVSLNTTKTHISNIYAKLGVSRRTQALQKVRQISLSQHQE